MIPVVSSLIEAGLKLADKFITTPQEKQEFMLEMERVKQAGVNAALEYEAQKEKEATERERIAVEQYKTEVGDRSSARDREVSLRNTIGVYAMWIIAFMVILAFLGVSFMVVFVPIPPENKLEAGVAWATLGTLSITVINYCFGSSGGSSRNGDALRKIAEQATSQTTPSA